MKFTSIDGIKFKESIRSGANHLKSNTQKINDLNVFPVPDGDTGTNMSLTMEAAVKELSKIDSENVSDIVKALSHGTLMGARGNSGVILSQIFRGFQEGIKHNKTLDNKVLANGLFKAQEVAYNAVMKPTEGTILTVAREIGEFAEKNYKQFEYLDDFFEKILEIGEKSLNNTPNLLPVLKEAGVVDAGGMGYLTILEGIYHGITGQSVEIEEDIHIDQYEELMKDDYIPEGEIVYGYCTEFTILGDSVEKKLEKLRFKLMSLGDSMLAVAGDDVIKVHVHTNHPGRALELGAELGQLSDIDIDNMRLQQKEMLNKKNLDKKPIETKKYSIVAVSAGDGIAEILEELNVEVIVKGGQTMNPSTEDLAKAINSTNGENVILFPNNKNIILSANQTVDLTDKNVIVIPTTNITEAISALLVYNEDESPEELEEKMNEAIEYVKTGEITYAVRDTELNGRKIQKDEIIGITNGEIISNGNDKEQTVISLIEEMIDEDDTFLTLIYGEDIKDDEAEDLLEILEDKFEDLDIQLINGKQPIYYYIISLE